ncbi:MAG: hypothetical protein HZA84_02215 [Thaumarchaeota archaeon]|nr:hypothetical protein [Nitrososphaerota archaeon]
MTKNVKVTNIFFVILAVTLILTQFQVLSASAELTFSTEKITIPGSSSFGWSVQRLNDGFAVGEPFAGPSSSGKVYIFSSDGTLGSILTNPGDLNDEFGYSLGIDGNILAVGAPGNAGNKGIVYLFDTTGSSTPIVSIPNSLGANNDRMGEDKMTFFNEDLLIGVSHANNKAGIINQFDQSGSLVQSYTNPSGINIDDQFGRSITVDGQLILTGAHGVLSETGEAHVISDSSAIKFENPSSFAEKQDDRFGWSTETTSTAYVIGAPTAEVDISGGTAQQGAVYLFHKDDSAIFDVFTSPDTDGTNVADQFGYWIAESDNLILVGAPDDDVEINGVIYTDAGSAYLFENNNHVATFHNPDPADNDRFGYSVDILNGKLIFGAPGDEGGAGAVYYAVISNEFAAKLDITADPDPAIIGEDVTLTYTITNIGTSDLKSIDGDFTSLITVTDDTCSLMNGPSGDIADAILNVGESWAFTCTKAAPSDPFTETVNEDFTTITFDNHGQPQTLYCADAEFLCGSINVNIASGGLTMAISSNPMIALNGETVNVDFNVLNTGTVPLFIDGSNGVVVDNENCIPMGESQGQITLEPGFDTHFTCTVTATRSPMVFNANATAIDLSDNQITITAQYTLDVINREITLEISAQPDPTYIGTLTTVTYNVTNIGNSLLTIDGQGGVVESLANCIPFAQNGVVTMQSGEFIEFTCTVTGTASPINFNATAFALYENNVVIPSNSTTFTLNSISPEIRLDVSAVPNPVNASSTTTLISMVTNTGNSILTIDGLTGIVDANNNCNPTATTGIHTINPSQQLAFTCTVTAGSSEINFDLTATALDENGNPVSDHQLLNVKVASLALTITSVPPEPIPYGGTPTITFTVTNNGTVNFTDVLFDETLNPLCIPVGPSGLLTPGQSRDYQCTIPTVTQDISLNGMATGIYDVGQFVKQRTITFDVLPSPIQLFCGMAKSDYGANVFEGGPGNDNLTGTNGIDLIIGNGGNDKIKGKDGNDCIIGGDGDDKIWGGKGNDTIEGNAGNDNIYGQDGDDTISGGDGDDKIWGGKGNDTIEGNAGNDQIHGQQDNDIITGADGDDKIWGGQGNDAIDAGTGNDRVSANQGDDNIIGGDGNDWLSAGIGNDVVNAGLGDDKIFGRQGNDNLFGEAGNDIIHGGQGNDLLNGGPNNDQCYGGQGTNTFVDCESQKPMNEENEEAEEQEESENDDNNGNHGNGKNNKDKKKN